LIAAIFIKMLAAAAASIAVAVVNLWFFSRLATKKRGIAAIKVPLDRIAAQCALKTPIPQIANHGDTARSSISSHWPVRPAGFLDPEFTPAGRADFTVDQRARVRLLEFTRCVRLLTLAPQILGDALLRRLTCNKRWNETNTKCSWQLFSGESVFGGRHPAGAVVFKQNALARMRCASS
jgi:hypothetical protein